VPHIVIEYDADDDLGIVRRAIERDISAHEQDLGMVRRAIERDISAREQQVGAYRNRMVDDRMADYEHELTVLRAAKTEITNAELDCRFGPGNRPMRRPDQT
jgi:hypothetical protein